MGDRLRAAKPSRYEASQLGRLSILPLLDGKLAMVNVVITAAYKWICWLWLIGLAQRSAATWRCVLHSSDEPGELSQWQCTATMTAPLTLSWLLLLLLHTQMWPLQ